jgi:radical SAM superfamily enzyme YgiQ (UPF0313 family)
MNEAAEQKIKQRALDENLPPVSELRKYLSEKDETAKILQPRREPNFVPYRKIENPKVLLIMPPMCLYEGAVKRVVPPLGLCYIAAALEIEGFDVTILDCIVDGIRDEEMTSPGVWQFGMSERRFREYVRNHEFDVVGLSMIYSSDILNLYRCAQIVKEIKPETIVVAGGLHASIYSDRFMRDAAAGDSTCIDFVIRGEGERRMAMFLRNLTYGKLDLNQDGLVGWQNGELFNNPQHEQITDLDALPFPAYHKVPIESYFLHNVPFSPYPRGKRVMQIYSSRGCPIGCTFCASTNFAKAYRMRSPDNVIDEIRFYKEKYDIDEIQFADDNLTLNRPRALELFSKMADLAIPWCTPNGIMVNTLDQTLLDKMVESGLYQITLSLDSGNVETLKHKHRKPVDLSRIPDLMTYLGKRGILMHGTVVVGMPGETEEDINKGFDFVRQLPFNSINVFIAQPIPGSELFENEIYKGTITYESSLHIDTARAIPSLSGIEPDRLEKLVKDFLESFNKSIRVRDPAAWDNKYAAHIDRMKRICIGAPSSNTTAIINAAKSP